MVARARCARGARWEALGSTVDLRVTDARALRRRERASRASSPRSTCACSRFRADSELSRVNARAGTSGPREPHCCSRRCSSASTRRALTDGDVDPTLGRALELARL